MLNSEVPTQQHMFQSTLELQKDISGHYTNINIRPEYQPNSEYVPLIDPEPPPYMISENISRPKLPGPYTVYPPIINTIVPSSSSTYQYSSRIYILSKKLHLFKERMTYKYWYSMGSDLFLKTLRNSTMTYNFNTKIIVQHFNVQTYFIFEWEELSVGNIQGCSNDESSNIQRLWMYISAVWGVTENTQVYSWGYCIMYNILFIILLW